MTTNTTRTAAALEIAARIATAQAANHNAIGAWDAADVAPCEHDASHLTTSVYTSRPGDVIALAASEIECSDWRVETATVDRRNVVRLVPRHDASRRTRRVERVLRAYLRAVGVDCC